ncbi:MAG: major capsid protein [Gammaproteobacteria bacterium]|nr:major capsid protein [Gammaproteobacteria bacterium]
MIDMFKSRTMLAALNQGYAPRTFLAMMFFANEEEHGSEYIDIDIVKGKRIMAPFVSPRAEGRVVKSQGRTVKSYKPPYLKPKRITSAEDIVKRNAGNSIYSAQSLIEKSGQKLGEDLVELTDSVTRRIEWMCASALTTGKIVVSGVVDEGDDASVVDDEIDFGLDASHNITLTGTALWTDAASNPITALRTWKRLIAQDSGLSARAAVLGSDVVDAFINNAKVQAQLSLRRVELGVIKPEELPEGVTYIGYLNDPGLDLYAYDEWYVDDAGAEQPMIPVDRIVMGATNARATRHYGPIMDMEAIDEGMAVGKWFPKSWRTKDPSARHVMVQSAPVVVPHQIDAFLTVKAV